MHNHARPHGFGRLSPNGEASSWFAPFSMDYHEIANHRPGHFAGTLSEAGTIIIDGDTVDIEDTGIRICPDMPVTFRPRCERELVLGPAANERLTRLALAASSRSTQGRRPLKL